MLHLIREYADRLGLPPPLYAERPVRYRIRLTAEGDLEGVDDTADPSARALRHGARRAVPTAGRSSDIRPQLLADDAEYTFGRDAGKGPARAERRRAAYLGLLVECGARTGEPAVAAVLRFLGNPPPAELTEADGFDPEASIDFSAGGAEVAGLPSVREFWAERGAAGDESADVLQCLVCTRERPAMRRLKEKIGRIPGGYRAGASLFPAKSSTLSSWGLEEALTSPVCGECGERLAKGLNALLASGDAVRIGDMAFAAWTDGESGFPALGPLVRPGDFAAGIDACAALPPDAPPEEFAARFGVPSGERVRVIGLSAGTGRAAVRSWREVSAGEAARNASLWYARQEIAGAYGERGAPRLGLYALAAAAARDMRQLPSVVPRALVDGFLTGGPLPDDLLIRAVRRTQADSAVRRSHAALIKTVLRSQDGGRGGGASAGLHEESESAAYHCGRLFAQMEHAQRTASGRRGTIADRYFGKASSFPAAVFGPLAVRVQMQLSALAGQRPPAARAIRRRIEEIADRIPGELPAALAPREQGEFVLGYYHQRAANRAEAAARGGFPDGDTEEDAPEQTRTGRTEGAALR